MIKTTEACEQFLNSQGFDYELKDMKEGNKDFKKVVREIINPFLRTIRKKNANVPLVQISRTKQGYPLLKLSTEHSYHKE